MGTCHSDHFDLLGIPLVLRISADYSPCLFNRSCNDFVNELAEFVLT